FCSTLCSPIRSPAKQLKDQPRLEDDTAKAVGELRKVHQCSAKARSEEEVSRKGAKLTQRREEELYLAALRPPLRLCVKLGRAKEAGHEGLPPLERTELVKTQ